MQRFKSKLETFSMSVNKRSYQEFSQCHILVNIPPLLYSTCEGVTSSSPLSARPSSFLQVTQCHVLLRCRMMLFEPVPCQVGSSSAVHSPFWNSCVGVKRKKRKKKISAWSVAKWLAETKTQTELITSRLYRTVACPSSKTWLCTCMSLNMPQQEIGCLHHQNGEHRVRKVDLYNS